MKQELVKRQRPGRSAEPMSPFLRKGRGMILEYYSALEVGPKDFDDRSVDPSFAVEIAKKGGYTGLLLHKGVAEKYYDGSVPLIVRLNGRALERGEALGRQLCSVDYAVDSIGAKAVAYLIYLGSGRENIMLAEFGRIQEQAHERGIPVMALVFRPGATGEEAVKEAVAHTARAALELGADAAGIWYSGDSKSFEWAVKSAGKTKVFISGGTTPPSDEGYLQQVKDAVSVGAAGASIGRKAWMHQDPIGISKSIGSVIFGTRVK